MDTKRLRHKRTIIHANEINPYLALQRQLVAKGLLHETKLEQQFDRFEPVPVEGKPASEILSEERC